MYSLANSASFILVKGALILVVEGISLKCSNVATMDGTYRYGLKTRKWDEEWCLLGCYAV
jgi:hypothetical protein